MGEEETPEGNNVYGVIACAGSLEAVAKVLRKHFSVGPEGVAVKNPGYLAVQQLRVDAWPGDFLVYGGDGDEYLFNGAVAGTDEVVCRYVKDMHSALCQAGYRTTFEVHDDEGNCIVTFSS